MTEVTEVTGVTDLLAAAVAGIKRTERPGQVTMARAVQRTIVSGEHLAVQAGTSTGKSLAYLESQLPSASAATARNTSPGPGKASRLSPVARLTSRG